MKLKLKIEQVKNTTTDIDCDICILNTGTCDCLVTQCPEGQYFKLADKKPKKKKKKELKLTPLNIHRFNSRETCTRCGMSKKYFEWVGSDCFDNPMVKFLP